MGISVTNAFVTKLNSNGTALVYSTYLGGGSTDSGNGIAVDSDWECLCRGLDKLFRLPGYQRCVSKSERSRHSGFATKMNPTGSSLVVFHLPKRWEWSFTSGIAVDNTGSAYVAGTGSAALLGTPTLYGSGGYLRSKTELCRLRAFLPDVCGRVGHCSRALGLLLTPRITFT